MTVLSVVESGVTVLSVVESGVTVVSAEESGVTVLSVVESGVLLGYSECVLCVGSMAVRGSFVTQYYSALSSGEVVTVWTFGVTSVPLACVHCLVLVVLNACLRLCNWMCVLCVCMCVVLAGWCSLTGSQPICPGYCP